MEFDKLTKNKKKLVFELSSMVAVACLISCLYNNGIIKKKSDIRSINVPTKYYDFDDYINYKIVNGEKKEVFNYKNIDLLIDKDTKDMQWYIHGTELLTADRYELDTKKQVYYTYPLLDYGCDFWEQNFLEQSYYFEMEDINNYLENYKLNEFYSEEELYELEPMLKEAILIMNDDSYTKNTTKTLVKKNNY